MKASPTQRILPLWAVLALAPGACAGEDGDGTGDGTGPRAGDSARMRDGGSGGESAAFGNAPAGSGAGAMGPDAARPATDDDASCAEVSANTQLEPVHLAFAFDVSGSMGKGDEPWHDKALKWDPVVLATRTFFEDPASAGLNASMTFFPEDGDEDERCLLEAYTEPDVGMTPLPSQAFGAAMDAIEPQSDDDWRGGTPTVWVLRGLQSYIEAQRAARPGAYAKVLVTDGYPQGCSDDDDTIEAVVEAVELARATGVATYVVGIANPDLEDAPDTVSDLHAVAEAGGTTEAFLIDTGDPEMTSHAFAGAVGAIREGSVSCTLPIPEPPDGRRFDLERIAVRFTAQGMVTDLTYDAGCAGTSKWHYDDASDPRQIVLCDDACAQLQAAADAEVEVRFVCESLLSVD